MKKINFKELLGEVRLNKIANDLLKMSDEQIVEQISQLDEETKNSLIDILEAKLPKPRVKVPKVGAPKATPDAPPKVDFDPNAQRNQQVQDIIKQAGGTPSSRSSEIDSMKALDDMQITNTRGKSQGGPTAAELKAFKDGEAQTQKMKAREPSEPTPPKTPETPDKSSSLGDKLKSNAGKIATGVAVTGLGLYGANKAYQALDDKQTAAAEEPKPAPEPEKTPEQEISAAAASAKSFGDAFKAAREKAEELAKAGKIKSASEGQFSWGKEGEEKKQFQTNVSGEKYIAPKKQTKVDESLLAAFNKVVNSKHPNIFQEAKGSVPKTEKEKKLAALAEPKDKITHKDVLVGRGVIKEKESIEEAKLPRKLSIPQQMKNLGKDIATHPNTAKIGGGAVAGAAATNTDEIGDAAQSVGDTASSAYQSVKDAGKYVADTATSAADAVSGAYKKAKKMVGLGEGLFSEEELAFLEAMAIAPTSDEQAPSGGIKKKADGSKSGTLSDSYQIKKGKLSEAATKPSPTKKYDPDYAYSSDELAELPPDEYRKKTQYDLDYTQSRDDAADAKMKQFGKNNRRAVATKQADDIEAQDQVERGQMEILRRENPSEYERRKEHEEWKKSDAYKAAKAASNEKLVKNAGSDEQKYGTHEIEFADKPGQKFKALGKDKDDMSSFNDQMKNLNSMMKATAGMASAAAGSLQPKGMWSTQSEIGSGGKGYQSSVYPDDQQQRTDKKLSSGALYNPSAKLNLKKVFEAEVMDKSVVGKGTITYVDPKTGKRMDYISDVTKNNPHMQASKDEFKMPNPVPVPTPRPKNLGEAKNQEDNEPVATGANKLHVNAKKAADYNTPNVKHKFENGEEVVLTRGMASDFLARHRQAKTSDDKDAILKHANKSLDAFKSIARGGKVPSEPKASGKPKVSLGTMKGK